MKKTAIVFGGIAGGLIVAAGLVATFLEGASLSELFGYGSMLVGLSMVFIGVKRYRDRELGGVIRFTTALLVGLAISAVATVIYVVAWEVNLFVTDYTFISDYAQSMIAAREASGASPEELESYRKEVADMVVNYGNPLFRIPMTFIEIFPVGLLVSLLSAAILRNSRVLPASGPA
ncbi:MAG: DUF4199 domain-containing protein [Myxococcota bacterium]